MLDHGKKWSVSPDWSSDVIDAPGLRVKSVSIGSQFYVSGDLDGFRARFGLPAPVGALGEVVGERYCVRLASDRMLVVGLDRDAVQEGWNTEGYAVTSMTSGLRAFELSGAEAASIISRGSVLDPAKPSASAIVMFAGAGVCIYRHGEAIRLHVDRGLAAYIWGWIASRVPFIGAA